MRTRILIFLALSWLAPAARADEPRQEDLDALRSTIESLQEEEARIRISGDERVRVMNIDADSGTSTGPYGEVLTTGNTVRYRLGLRVDATVTPSLTAGGWVRVSNEGHRILTQGPEYLSLDWGSAYVRYSGRVLRMTCGFYPLHFTPLTMMRWDLEDNPQGGGSMACAVCGTATGLLRAESLEELGPTLVFEGARAAMSLGDVLDVMTFYANPNRTADSLFHRDLYGVRSVFHLFGPGSSSVALGTTYYRADDEEESLSPLVARLGEIETELMGLDAEVSPLEEVTFTGEWTRTHDSQAWGRRRGEAFLVGTRILLARAWAASVHYMHLDPSFRSPYAALSYLANREGWRASAGWRTQGRRVTAAFFYKHLVEVEAEAAIVDPAEFTTWGGTLTLKPHARTSVEASWIADLETRGSRDYDLFRKDMKKQTVVLDWALAVGPRSEVRARVQVTDFENRHRTAVFVDKDSRARLTSLMWSVEF